MERTGQKRIDAVMLAERWCLALERRFLVEEVVEEATSRRGDFLQVITEFVRTILERIKAVESDKDPDNVFTVKCKLQSENRKHWLGDLVSVIVRYNSGLSKSFEMRGQIQEMFKFMLEQHCLVCADKILNLLDKDEAQSIVDGSVCQWIFKCDHTKYLVGEDLEVTLWLIARSSGNRKQMVEKLRRRADHRDATDHYIRNSSFSLVRALQSVLTSA